MNLFFTNVNWVAVLAAAVLNMTIGSLWYSSLVLGKQWTKLMEGSGKNLAEMKKGAVKAYAVSFLSALLLAYVLASVVSALDAFNVLQGATVAFWLWLGFIATTSLSGVLFEQRSFNLYLINAGYYLVSFLLMGALFAAWQ